MTKRKKKGPWVKSAPAWMVTGCAGKHGKDDFQAFRDRRFMTGGQSSAVRRIDPVTGVVVETMILEAVADSILKADAKPRHKPKTKKIKLPKKAKKIVPDVETKEAFYRSWEWRTLRMDVLKAFGRTCQCCGATPKDKTPAGGRVRIVVDHIRPVSKFWHLRMDKSNLQVLCDECNQGKGNWDQTDYRTQAHEPSDELAAEYREIMRQDETNVVRLRERVA